MAGPRILSAPGRGARGAAARDPVHTTLPPGPGLGHSAGAAGPHFPTHRVPEGLVADPRAPDAHRLPAEGGRPACSSEKSNCGINDRGRKRRPDGRDGGPRSCCARSWEVARPAATLTEKPAQKGQEWRTRAEVVSASAAKLTATMRQPSAICVAPSASTMRERPGHWRRRDRLRGSAAGRGARGPLAGGIAPAPARLAPLPPAGAASPHRGSEATCAGRGRGDGDGLPAGPGGCGGRSPGAGRGAARPQPLPAPVSMPPPPPPLRRAARRAALRCAFSRPPARSPARTRVRAPPSAGASPAAARCAGPVRAGSGWAQVRPRRRRRRRRARGSEWAPQAGRGRQRGTLRGWRRWRGLGAGPRAEPEASPGGARALGAGARGDRGARRAAQVRAIPTRSAPGVEARPLQRVPRRSALPRCRSSPASRPAPGRRALKDAAPKPPRVHHGVCHPPVTGRARDPSKKFGPKTTGLDKALNTCSSASLEYQERLQALVAIFRLGARWVRRLWDGRGGRGLVDPWGQTPRC